MMAVFAGGYLAAPFVERMAMNLLPSTPTASSATSAASSRALIGFAFGFVLERAGFGSAPTSRAVLPAATSP